MDNIFLSDTRVYIAGILFPAIEVGITSTINQPPTATVTVPADYRLYNVGENDRVPLLIFQRESFVDSQNYVLMFEGFITARLYLNTALQRNITFNAVSIFDIMNDMRIRYMSTLNDMYRAVIPGQAQKEVQTPMISFPFPQYLFMHGLGAPGAQVPDQQDQSINYPYEYLDNVYRFIGGDNADLDEQGEPQQEQAEVKQDHGSTVAKYFIKMAGYYQLARRFLKVPYYDECEGDGEDAHTDVWGSKENAKGFPILKGIQDKSALEVLAPFVASQKPDTQTAMEVVQQIATPMDFEFAMLPSPPYIGGNPDSEDFYHQKSRLGSTILKPVFCDSLAPMCNVMFRSQVREINSHTQYKGVPTRIQVHDINSPLAKMRDNANIDAQYLFEWELTSVYPLNNLEKSVLFDPTRNKIASYILDTEKYTGPWVHEVTTPTWWNWTDTVQGTKGEYLTSSGTKIEPLVATRQILDHRQLIMARYMTKQLTVSMTFNPYVIVGFPGVVFDAEETGMSFAGYVSAVSHVIGANGMETTVQMTYVRPLYEAKDVVIVHPMEDLQELLHDPEKMTVIYEGILGGDTEYPKLAEAQNDAAKAQDNADAAKDTAGKEGATNQQKENADSKSSDADKKNSDAKDQKKAADSVTAGAGVLKNLFKIKPVSGFKGAKAVSYDDLFTRYMEGTDDREDPQHNPSAAYAEQRRNICTFDQYIEFCGLTVENGSGPAGENIPMYINGTYMEERNTIKTYARKRKDNKEEAKEGDNKSGDASKSSEEAAKETAAKEADAQKTKAEAATTAGQGQPADAGSSSSSSTSSTASTDSAASTDSSSSAANETGNENGADKKEDQDKKGLKPGRDIRQERPADSKKYEVIEIETNLRELLKIIARDAFAKQVYA